MFARIPCALVVLVVGVGCRFEAPGESGAVGLDDSATTFPIDSGSGDVGGFDVPPESAGDGSADAETIDDAPVDDAATSEDAIADDSPADLSTDVPPPCAEAGAIRYGDHCYFVIVDTGPAGAGVDETTAEFECAATSPPAHLATMNTPGEHTVLDTICASGFHCWVGLTSSKKSKLTTDFHWTTGETGFDGAWCGGYPNDNGLCGSWYETPPGCYQDIDCAATHTHIACERD